MNLIKHKKGSAFDIIYILIVLFMIMIVTLVAVKIYNEWAKEAPTKLKSGTSNMALEKTSDAFGALDLAFGFLVGILLVLVIISAFTIDTHPAFFVVTLILLIIALILAVAFSNIYETIATEKMEDEASGFPIGNFLMSKLPLVALIAIVLVSIVLYAKFKLS